MSKRKEMIRILDSISDFNTYSNYSILLRKIFKNKCLEDLVSSLKHPIHIETFEFFKNTEIPKKENNGMNLRPIDQNQNVKNIKKELDLLNDNGEDIEEEKRIKEEKMKSMKKKKKSFSLNNIKTTNKYNYELNPFKYHPNYNSIYKNIHGFKMVPHKTLPLKIKNSQKLKATNLKFDLNSNISLFKKHSDEYKSYNSESTTISYEKGLKNKIYKTLPDLKYFTQKSKVKTKINFKFNFNHTRRFSKYLSRNNNIYQANNILTYIEPHNYTRSKKDNKSIDFKKMIKRKSKDLLNKQLLLNPSFTYYNPKYDLIETKPIRILFNSNDYNKKTKKYMLKKLWSSYYLVEDYLLVDNNKLKKKTNLNLDV